jgi:hypothetical protein
MSESIHIFDEFLSEQENENERHRKRMSLDPLIYDCLKAKYFIRLKKEFQTYKSPRPTGDIYKAAVCLVEGRIHPHMEFLIYSIAYFARGWKIIVCCSDINERWLKEVLGPRSSEILCKRVFNGSAGREQGRKDYNDLLRSAEFYESLPAESLLFLETDCYIRKTLPLYEWNKYDYIACPISWESDKENPTLVGGASFRKRDAAIRVCKEYISDEWAHDIFMNDGTKSLGLKRPPFEKLHDWFSESCFYGDPVVVHQWWTFFSPDSIPHAELIFSNLMTLKIVEK